jgi:hypothetical protein
LIDIISKNSLEYGNWNYNKSYIILPNNKELIIREVPQEKGGIKYAIDQMKNEESIVLSMGGNYENIAVIPSKIATIHSSPFIKDLILHTLNFIRKYKNTDGFYISPEVLEKAKNGFRLSTDIKTPVEYDLTLKD